MSSLALWPMTWSYNHVRDAEIPLVSRPATPPLLSSRDTYSVYCKTERNWSQWVHLRGNDPGVTCVYNVLWPACLSALAQFVLRSVGVFTSVGWGISGQESAVYRENLRLNWSRYWHQRAPEPSSSTGWNQIFILWWRTYSREIQERTEFWQACKDVCTVYILWHTWNIYMIIPFGERERKKLQETERNNQLCREVWWYIIQAICSSSCVMAPCARASVQSTRRASPSWSHLAQLSSHSHCRRRPEKCGGRRDSV